jgi:hypothetical protein
MAPILPAAAAQLGPPPGATLSIEKLSKIDDFFNAEDATGRMPGAIVLIQHHGKPVPAKFSLSLLDAMRPSAYGIYLGTTSSSSGCSTQSTIIHGRRSSNLRSCSLERCQGVGHLPWHSKYPSWPG